MCFRCSLARSLAECFDSGVRVWLSSATGRVERCVEPSQSFPAYTNGVFPLGEQLSLPPPPSSLIHASPKMTLFSGERQSRLHIN